MFKISSLEEELRNSMEKQLVANQVESNHGFNKLAKAADYLNSAAKTFEKAGMHSEAKEVIDILKNLIKELGNA